MSAGDEHAVVAGHVFDGLDVRRDAALVMRAAEVVAVVPRADLPVAMRRRELGEGVWLAPGFIDLQVNGGGDVLFNDTPTPQAIATIAAAHRKFGTTTLLPTLISDSEEKMKAAIDAVEALAGVHPGVLGIHLEGPFLSPQRCGVHALAALRAPTQTDRSMLTAARTGAMLVTLAPEQVPPGFIAGLAQAGIRVALGHSMATYAQTKAAMAEGLTGFTHLFNAMRPLASREGGPIAAALESPQAWFGMIVDGIHVDPAMLRLALRGLAHPMLVTDAMPPVGGTASGFRLYGEEMEVRDRRCARKDGTLAGAFLDMATAVRNCVAMLDVPLASALQLASLNPARFLGAERLGRLAPGCRADMVAFDPGVRVIETWVAGSSASGQ
jgi:N-acetylglucosamine-6-phosphate deacetylase